MATESIALYVDGRPIDSRYSPGLWAATGPLVVGRGAPAIPGVDRFTGSVDQVRTYNRALTPAEVNGLFRAGG